MLVTRAEEWCVEADSPEEARELLAAGLGHRCHLGERVQFEVDRVEEWYPKLTVTPAVLRQAERHSASARVSSLRQIDDQLRRTCEAAMRSLQQPGREEEGIAGRRPAAICWLDEA